MSLLQTHRLTAHYGDFQALYGIDFEIDAGEVVAVIGANGAGKSTFLHSLSGFHPVPCKCVQFMGESIGALPAHEVVKKGIALVPEGRCLFPSLNVRENLLLGAESKRAGYWNLARVFSLFPVLDERQHVPATALSGGQQQMVAIGRALMSNPVILLCDEISLGLAPTVIRDIYQTLTRIVAEGTAVVIVEQDISQALKVAGRVYCVQEGRVSLSGACNAFDHAQISAAYFGMQH